MSEWLGTIGETIAADVVVKGYIRRERWGTNMKLFLLEDKHGNLITIRSTSKFSMKVRWRINGKVKRHHKFNGQKQTHISSWELMYPTDYKG